MNEGQDQDQDHGATQAGLGIPTNTASPSGERRAVGRFALQNAARRLLPEHRVGACCRVLKPDAVAVKVLFDQEHGKAHYGGLMRCGSVWVCPVCGSAITERRAEELRGGLARHPELTPIMVTVTLQHRRGDSLSGLLKDLKAGMRFARSGKRWDQLKDRLGVVGSVTATEVTYSDRAGWHPHEHILFLCAGAADVDALRAFLTERFAAYLGRVGRYVSAEYGVQAVAGDAAAARYISKWDTAAELAKGNVKRSRSDGGMSPMMLLARAGDGDERCGALFIEYAEALHRRKLLTYSRGLRDLLGLNEDQTDEQLAEQAQAQAVELASLTVHQWRVVLANDARGELLDVASAGDAAALWSWLSRLWDDDG